MQVKPSIIGYAQADFEILMTSKKIYIDRTAFIHSLENHGNTNLLFVRPRRFGKSLWVSILHYYYGVEHKGRFETLFGHLAIGQKPTQLRNAYLVLRFQFAGIDVETDASTFRDFRKNVLKGVQLFIRAYPDFFSNQDYEKIELESTPHGLVQYLFQLHQERQIQHKIYVLIDEYDQFANELVSLDTERFRQIVGRTGFVRKFYEMIKSAANEGVVNRFFATGVSPLTVDSLTSGFNIASNISLDLKFHDLMGFKRPDVEYILRQVGAPEARLPNLIADLKDWYNGYLFHSSAKETLYNSDMIMYFASQYEDNQEYPQPMLDANIASDYTKVKKIFNIQQREQVFIPILKKLTGEGTLTAAITHFFNLEKTFTEYDLISLLFYMGWITIKDLDSGLYNFKMPNLVIRELYYNYFVDITEQEAGLNHRISDIQNALGELAKKNKPVPFLNLIKVLIDKDLSLRDAQKFDEKHLKMLLIAYLSLSASHVVVSEPEWENGYPDILFLKRPNVNTQYNFIIELKYVKISDENKSTEHNDKTAEKIFQKVEREAHVQLTNYIKTDHAKRTPNLKAWLFILVGRDWKVVQELPIN